MHVKNVIKLCLELPESFQVIFAVSPLFSYFIYPLHLVIRELLLTSKPLVHCMRLLCMCLVWQTRGILVFLIKELHEPMLPFIGGVGIVRQLIECIDHQSQLNHVIVFETFTAAVSSMLAGVLQQWRYRVVVIVRHCDRTLLHSSWQVHQSDTKQVKICRPSATRYASQPMAVNHLQMDRKRWKFGPFRWLDDTAWLWQMESSPCPWFQKPTYSRLSLTQHAKIQPLSRIKTLNGPRVRGISPVGKEKVHGRIEIICRKAKFRMKDRASKRRYK